MADFKKAFEKLKVHEGGYVNNPADRGGETYMGIARKYHSKAKFWKVIDALKKDFKGKTLNDNIWKSIGVADEIMSIYKSEYWDKFRLDYCPLEKLAYQIFDTAVNCGVVGACKLLQKVLGVKVDGKITDELLYKLINYGRNS